MYGFDGNYHYVRKSGIDGIHQETEIISIMIDHLTEEKKTPPLNNSYLHPGGPEQTAFTLAVRFGIFKFGVAG